MAIPAAVEQTSSGELLRSECYPDKIERLVRICEATTWTANYEDIFERMALALAVNLESDYANIYLLDVDGDNMTTYGSHSLVPNYNTIDKKAINSKPTLLGRLRRMIVNKEPIIMDYRNPHPCDQIPKEAFEGGFLAAITVPLMAADEVIGIYNLVYKREIVWSEQELTFLKAIGRMLGVNIHRAQMSRKVVQMQILNERKFLSSEIHDNLAQSVSSLKLGTETALMLLESGDLEALQESLERLEGIGLQAVKLLREEMLSLRIPQSETQGLIPAITETLSMFRDRWAVQTELVVEGENEPGVTVQTELQVMRIIHESLSNVLRHANANSVTICLRQTGRRLHIEVRDDGRGFDVSSVSSERLGIRIMKERAESVGGILTVESVIGQGTSICLETPSVTL